MLFGHTYYVKATVLTNEGNTLALKGTFEARFVDADELKAGVKEELQRKVWYEYNQTITQFINMEIR